MTCTICGHGDIEPGARTTTFERGGTTVVIKGVPAGVCNNCGEEYVSEETTRRLMKIANAAARTGAELEVRQFAAA